MVAVNMYLQLKASSKDGEYLTEFWVHQSNLSLTIVNKLLAASLPLTYLSEDSVR